MYNRIINKKGVLKNFVCAIFLLEGRGSEGIAALVLACTICFNEVLGVSKASLTSRSFLASSKRYEWDSND